MSKCDGRQTPPRHCAPTRRTRVEGVTATSARPRPRGRCARTTPATASTRPTWPRTRSRCSTAGCDEAHAAIQHDANAMVVSTVGAGRRAVLADGAAQGRLGRRVRLLHQHRLAQGRRAGRQPALRAALPVAPARAAGPRRRRRRRRCRAPTSRPTSPAARAAPSSAPWASHQSQVVSGRAELEAAYADAEARYAGRDVPAPEEWGGYVVRPEVVEFWQGRTVAAARPAGLPAYAVRVDHGAARPLNRVCE